MTTTTIPERARRQASIWIRVACVLALFATVGASSSPPEQARADDAEFQQALDRINSYRSWIGIEPLRMDPALMEAAQSQSDYWAIHGDSMAGMGLHYQTPGTEGFTGETMSDRASNFGYDGSINENAGLSGSMLATVNWSIATISHRQTLLDPRYTDIGFGAVKTESGGGMETIMVGTRSWSHTADPAWQAWPVDGTTGVGLDMQGSVPSPLSAAPYPSGYPITLKYHGGGSVEFHSAELRTGGSPVPISSGEGNGWLSRNTMMIMSNDSLQPNTRYDVTVHATVDGQSVTHDWSFETGDSNGSLPAHDQAGFTVDLPERVGSLDSAIQSTWSAADGPVYDGRVNRSWLWGPDAFALMNEAYAQSPGGERAVAYFDKTRMEINDPDGDRSSQWFVTNGHLVLDMIRGSIQVGDNEFQEHGPAQIAIAGDNLEFNPEAPTYASLFEHSFANDGYREPDRTGEAVMTRISQGGSVHHGPEVPEGVHYGHYDEATGFNVADVFWNSISGADHYDWLYAVGHPVTDPHWVSTRVDGEERWVLVQAFQRRLLTFTPANDADWQIEMGNVGRHYYTWRYGEAPPE